MVVISRRQQQAGFYAEIEECHTREKLNIRRKIVIVQPGQTKTATGRILSGGCALVLSIFVKVPNQGAICYPTIRVHITMLFIFPWKIRTFATAKIAAPAPSARDLSTTFTH